MKKIPMHFFTIASAPAKWLNSSYCIWIYGKIRVYVCDWSYYALEPISVFSVATTPHIGRSRVALVKSKSPYIDNC